MTDTTPNTPTTETQATMFPLFFSFRPTNREEMLTRAESVFDWYSYINGDHDPGLPCWCKGGLLRGIGRQILRLASSAVDVREAVQGDKENRVYIRAVEGFVHEIDNFNHHRDAHQTRMIWRAHYPQFIPAPHGDYSGIIPYGIDFAA